MGLKAQSGGVMGLTPDPGNAAKTVHQSEKLNRVRHIIKEEEKSG